MTTKIITPAEIAREIYKKAQANPHRQAAGALAGAAIHAALIFEIQSHCKGAAPILEAGKLTDGGLPLSSWVNVWANPATDSGYFDLTMNPPVINAVELPGRSPVASFMIHDFQELMRRMYQYGCGPLIAELSPVLDSIYNVGGQEND